MTVSNIPRTQSYVGDGANLGPFAFGFRLDNDAWISVKVNNVVQTLGVDYTVSRNADQIATPGGSVTFTVAPGNTLAIGLTGATPIEQVLLNLVAFGDFPAEAQEAALDRLTMIAQEAGITQSAQVTYANLNASGGVGYGSAQVPNGAAIKALVDANTAHVAVISGNPHNVSRSNISAAKDGANSDITSLSGLTTGLSVAQGGTGQSTEQDAIDALTQSAGATTDYALMRDSSGNAVWSEPPGAGTGGGDINSGTQLDAINPNIFRDKVGASLRFRALASPEQDFQLIENTNDVSITLRSTARQEVDASSRSFVSTVLTNHTEFSAIELSPNYGYKIEYHLKALCASAVPDLNFGWGGFLIGEFLDTPLEIFSYYDGTTVTNVTRQLTTTSVIPLAANVQTNIDGSCSVMRSGAALTFLGALQFAQNTADATAVQILRGSWLKITRVNSAATSWGLGWPL